MQTHLTLGRANLTKSKLGNSQKKVYAQILSVEILRLATNSMSRKHIQKQIVLLSMLLLIGQFAMLTHSSEHPFHEQDQSCQVFLQCENSDNGLSFHGVQLPTRVDIVQAPSRLVSLWSPTPSTRYFSRAPPSFS